MKNFLIKYINAFILYAKTLFALIATIMAILTFVLYTNIKIGTTELAICGLILLFIPPLFLIGKAGDRFERWWFR